MPAYTVCTIRIRGPETLYTQHHYPEHEHDEYNYSSYSENAHNTHCRMGTGTGTGTRTRHAHFADNQDIHKQYDTGNALVRHRTHDSFTGSRYLFNELAKPLVHVFDSFSNTHAIASVHYSAMPSSGTYFLSALANTNREQCTNCLAWFPDGLKLHYHQQEFPVGCEQCKLCVRRDNIAYHATNFQHERCFVRGCESDYRMMGNWRHGSVERHILGRHIQRGYY